jgi:hypothetical protein
MARLRLATTGGDPPTIWSRLDAPTAEASVYFQQMVFAVPSTSADRATMTRCHVGDMTIVETKLYVGTDPLVSWRRHAAMRSSVFHDKAPLATDFSDENRDRKFFRLVTTVGPHSQGPMLRLLAGAGTAERRSAYGPCGGQPRCDLESRGEWRRRDVSTIVSASISAPHQGKRILKLRSEDV